MGDVEILIWIYYLNNITFEKGYPLLEQQLPTLGAPQSKWVIFMNFSIGPLFEIILVMISLICFFSS